MDYFWVLVCDVLFYYGFLLLGGRFLWEGGFWGFGGTRCTRCTRSTRCTRCQAGFRGYFNRSSKLIMSYTLLCHLHLLYLLNFLFPLFLFLPHVHKIIQLPYNNNNHILHFIPKFLYIILHMRYIMLQISISQLHNMYNIVIVFMIIF